MASTNKTSNLELSQFIATDIPTWLIDYNGDMEKIDAGVANVQNQANTNTASVNGINNRLGNADISGIGDGTITGAINARNSNLKIVQTEYKLVTFKRYGASDISIWFYTSDTEVDALRFHSGGINLSHSIDGGVTWTSVMNK